MYRMDGAGLPGSPLRPPLAGVPVGVAAGCDSIGGSLDRWVADALRPTGFVLAAMYTLSVVNRATDPQIAAATPPTAAVLVVTFVVMGMLLVRRPLPPPLAHPVLLVGIGLIVLETLIRGPEIAGTDLPWAIIGAGAVALRPRWLVGALAMVVVPFALVAVLVPGSAWGAVTTTYRLDLVMASLLAGAVFFFRRRALMRLEAARAELRDAAHEDPLTGLPNRRGLAWMTAALRERAAREGGALMVGFLDLDGFKQVNDSDGHAVGDALLRAVARAIQRAVRAGDVVARVGGDEFAILAPSLLDPAPLSSRVTKAVRETTAAAGHEVGASLGWVELRPHDARPILDVVGDADRRMYEQRDRRRASAPGRPAA
jgi:diguanylate cyclase (GGDEF)-like protein